MRIVVEAQYFPSIQYFWLLNQSEEIILDVNEHYVKQTYRNRMVINGANGPLTLSIPIKHTQAKIVMKDVLVDHKEKWTTQHWRSIQSAYGKAAFFDHFSPYVEPVFSKPKKFLLDYLIESLSICQQLINIKLPIRQSDAYVEEPSIFDFDLRSVILPKGDKGNLSGFVPKPYFQLFGKDFVPNLSILDLLFCEGPNALEVLQSSGQIKKEQLIKTGRSVL